MMLHETRPAGDEKEADKAFKESQGRVDQNGTEIADRKCHLKRARDETNYSTADGYKKDDAKAQVDFLD